MAASQPPKFAERILGWFVKDEFLEEILGDLYEYHSDNSNLSRWKRNLYYWFHAFNMLRPSLFKNLSGRYKLNYFGMIQMLFKLNFRQMRKKLLLTSISLVTLVTGILSFQLTLSWIKNEISMDDFHSKKDRISVGVARLSPESSLIAFSISVLYRLDYSEFSEIEKSMYIYTYMPDEIKFHSDNVAYGGKGLVVDSTLPP